MFGGNVVCWFSGLSVTREMVHTRINIGLGFGICVGN